MITETITFQRTSEINGIFKNTVQLKNGNYASVTVQENQIELYGDYQEISRFVRLMSMNGQWELIDRRTAPNQQNKQVVMYRKI